MERLPVILNLDAVVASFGGVGTTCVMKFLRQHLRINSPHNVDGLKHTAAPPWSLKPGLKVVYVFGHPGEAVASLFRRGYAAAHARALQCQEPGAAAIGPELSLQGYVARGVEGFGLCRHYRQWAEAPTPYPVALVRYETLWSHLPALFDFLGLSRRHLHAFPRQRLRQSGLNGWPRSVTAGLDALYGPLAQELDSRPDFMVRPATGVSYLGNLARMPRALWQHREHVHPALTLKSYLGPLRRPGRREAQLPAAVWADS